MRRLTAHSIVVLVLLIPGLCRAELNEHLKKALRDSPYVYIQSTRKDGSLSKPAEIWFMYRNDAVYVGTSPKSWRAKRIRWGRPDARIAVGKADGPAYTAKGTIVKEPDVQQAMLDTYAKKYPEGWKSWEDRFRKQFQDGSRVLIKYVPK